MNTEKYKKMLIEEKEKLESELSTLSVHSEDDDNWEAKNLSTPGVGADRNEVADRFEDYNINNATVEALESKLKEVEHALGKIENGKYGICEVSGNQIEEKRLDANPSARTDIKNREATLPTIS